MQDPIQYFGIWTEALIAKIDQMQRVPFPSEFSLDSSLIQPRDCTSIFSQKGRRHDDASDRSWHHWSASTNVGPQTHCTAAHTVWPPLACLQMKVLAILAVVSAGTPCAAKSLGVKCVQVPWVLIHDMYIAADCSGRTTNYSESTFL